MESLQFTSKGPKFPGHLVNAMINGDVVFLCGAGISAPQLPSFYELVNECFIRLRLEKSAAEENSFCAGRYEEVLGSLSRRIVDPNELSRVIAEILDTEDAPDLFHHHTILRLSRMIDNQPLVVTTNFDTLLEQALFEREKLEDVQATSFAGQSMPSPGGADFGGIIHLHGRIANDRLGLNATPLVVTSANYGEAYMRGGWASRFLFDLCRCRTIVLIGYRAGDAPVRYLLNVLEADRQRFPDLHRVYALDAIDEHEKVDGRWQALAVEPITYKYESDAESGGKGHSALWRDLDRLAEVVEKPHATRQKWAREVLERNCNQAQEIELDRIAWLYRGYRDLWKTAVESIEDASWFDFFNDWKLWSDDLASSVIAAWIARDFESGQRFKMAIEWQRNIGRSLADKVSPYLRSERGLSDFWSKMWRLFLLNWPHRSLDQGGSTDYVRIINLLKNGVALNDDLEKAVSSLSPVLELSPRVSHLFGVSAPEIPERIDHLAWTRLKVTDGYGAAQVLDALVEFADPCTIMALATAKLESVVGLSVDMDAIGEGFDSVSNDLPSIEPHQQNEHREGPVYLVELISRVLRNAVEKDWSTTHRLVERWPTMTGELGIRLWLHALRETMLYTADEAINGLMDLSDEHFWTLRREIALVLRDRASDATYDSITAIEYRIITEGHTYFNSIKVAEGLPDWREHARDKAVWLRLNMIDASGSISDTGASELTLIKKRRDYLDREVEDPDFFDSYVSPVRAVLGDAQPISEAREEERLDVARKAIQSPDIEKQQGWLAYCQTDPPGAVDMLENEPLVEKNVQLWFDLVRTLAYSKGGDDTGSKELSPIVFNKLEEASDEFIFQIIRPLTDMYCSYPRSAANGLSAWWLRLFDIAERYDYAQPEPGEDLINLAISSPGGILTQALLIDISEAKKTEGTVGQGYLDTLVRFAESDGRQGLMSRAVLVANAELVMSVACRRIVTILDDVLGRDTLEAEQLRSVLVLCPDLHMSIYRAYSGHIIRGVTEVDSKGGAFDVASKIMAPAISVVTESEEGGGWGLTLDDVAQALRDGPASLREGSVNYLKRYLEDLEGNKADSWRNHIRPLLSCIWPVEIALRDSRQAPHFAVLAIEAGDAFPEAFDWVAPYLEVSNDYMVTLAMRKSEVPEHHPKKALSLLWKMYGESSIDYLYNIQEILDRFVLSLPSIEVDRRFQRLYQKCSLI